MVQLETDLHKIFVGQLRKNKATVSLKFSLCYFLRNFFDALCRNYYLGNFYFLIKRKQGVNNCFKLLISSVFTTVASRLKSEQKEKEK